MKIPMDNVFALAVDVQEKLFPHINNHEILLENMLKLIKGLKLLEVDFVLNEQYPKGIGHTIAPIKELLQNDVAHEKVTFSCCQTEETMDLIKKEGRKFVIVFGIEAHVCVLQTVLDLIDARLVPILVTDCIGSRKENDKNVAISRMMQAGAIPTTYESLLFELCGSAKHSAFRAISALIK
ncbi:isochorismatase family protein [Sulfurospirillum sp. 1612]|uniref:isochorismatase family protein n=1 Tax=Sulfurospirillum sp. 1612 TaxID=3094835 RepID=UPI002F93DE55